MEIIHQQDFKFSVSRRLAPFPRFSTACVAPFPRFLSAHFTPFQGFSFCFFTAKLGDL
jgi:hypothetical protein